MKAFIARLCVLFAALLLWGCSGAHDMRDIAKMQKEAKLNFPPATKWRNFDWLTWQDDYFCGVFELPKGQIPLLLDKPVEWSSTKRSVNNQSHKKRWFNPDSIAKFKSMELNYPEPNNFLGILYDDAPDTNSTTTVFLIWFDT